MSVRLCPEREKNSAENNKTAARRHKLSKPDQCGDEYEILAVSQSFSPASERNGPITGFAETARSQIPCSTCAKLPWKYDS